MGRYRVTGKRPVLGHQPDAVFDAELDEQLEARLLASGALTKSRAQQTDDDDHEDEGSGEA